MKGKNISKILFAGLLTLLLTGCGSNAVNKSIERTIKAGKFESNVTQTTSYNQSQEETNTLKIQNDTTSKTLKISSTFEDSIYSTKMDTYYLTDTFENYVTSDTTKIKEITEAEDEGCGVEETEADAKYHKNKYKYIYNLETFEKIFEKAKIKKIDSKTFDVEVPASEFYDALNGVLYFDTYTYVRLDKKVVMYLNFKVTVDGKYISKIEADLTNYIKEATKYDETNSILTEYKFTYTVSKVGSSESVTLPADAKTDFEDYAEADARTDAISYIGFVNTLNLEGKTYTSTEQLGKIIPEAVSLELKDGIVVKGTIKVNGYTFTYTEGEDGYELK